MTYDPHRDKTNKMACAPSENSDQPGHPPCLIRVFAVRFKKARILSYPLSAQRRLWSDWTDAQADLRLRWAHSHFVGFVTMRLIFRFLCYHKHAFALILYTINLKTLRHCRHGICEYDPSFGDQLWPLRWPPESYWSNYSVYKWYFS